MNKLKKIIKQKNGMTLIETVITFIVAGILIAATGALIITGLNLYQDTAARSLDKQIGDSVLELTSKQLLYAKSIEEVQVSPLPDMEEIGTAGALFIGSNALTPESRGYLYVKDFGTNESFREAYSKEFYSGREIELQLTVDKITAPKAITLTVQVIDDGKVGYEHSTSLQLINSVANESPLNTGAWSKSAIVRYTLPN